MKKTKIITLLLIAGIVTSCGSEPAKEKTPTKTPTKKEVAKTTPKVEEAPANENKGAIGVGPITSITLGEIDDALVEKGKEVYKANCTACHKIGKRFVGPALKGVTERRGPEWIMNMIMNPEEMVAKDPTAMALLAEYMAPMANQNIVEDEARAILEFLRTKN